jgi:hypothetical protein
MRKILFLTAVGMLVSSGAMACGWGSKSAQSSTPNQTVMTDHDHGGTKTTPKQTKSETKG